MPHTQLSRSKRAIRRKAQPVRLGDNTMHTLNALARFAGVRPNSAFRVVVALAVLRRR